MGNYQCTTCCGKGFIKTFVFDNHEIRDNTLILEKCDECDIFINDYVASQFALKEYNIITYKTKNGFNVIIDTLMETITKIPVLRPIDITNNKVLINNPKHIIIIVNELAAYPYNKYSIWEYCPILEMFDYVYHPSAKKMILCEYRENIGERDFQEMQKKPSQHTTI